VSIYIVPEAEPNLGILNVSYWEGELQVQPG